MASIRPNRSQTARAILVTTAAVLLAACSSTSTLNAQDLDKQIAAELQNEFDVEAVVECPDDVEAETGASFECTARDEEGNSLSLQVVQSDDQGNVDWSMDAFNLPAIEAKLEPEVSQSVDTEITIDCPRILVSSQEGTSLDCTATDEMGGEGVLRITSVDGEGNVDWELNP